jgi:hypothetical protein
VLSDAINKQLAAVRNETADPGENKVPGGLIQFIESQYYKNFLHALLEYCRELFRLENK